MHWTKALFLPAVLLTGCAAHPEDGGFGDVQSAAHLRTGADVRWLHDSADDAHVADQVRGIVSRQMSVDDAVQIALLNNPRLQGRYEELGVAQADLVAAGLMRNPVFDGSVRWPDDGKGPDVELSITASFLDLLYIPLRKRIATAELEQTKLEVTDAVVELAMQVRQAFFRLQGAQQMLELRKTVLAAEDAAAQTTDRLRQAGNINQLSADSEQATFEQARLDLFSADAEAMAARQQLASLMGMPDAGDQIKVPDRLPDLPVSEETVDRLEERAMHDRLSLAVAQAHIDSLRATLGMARQDRAGLSDVQIGIDTERQTDGQRITGPSISIPIPLFNFGQASIARADAQLRSAEREYDALRNDARSEVRLANQRLLTARERATQERNVVLPLRHRILEQSQLHYNGMLLGVFQLLDAKQAEIEAGRAYVESLGDYWVARAELSEPSAEG